MCRAQAGGAQHHRFFSASYFFGGGFRDDFVEHFAKAFLAARCFSRDFLACPEHNAIEFSQIGFGILSRVRARRHNIFSLDHTEGFTKFSRVSARLLRGANLCRAVRLAFPCAKNENRAPIFFDESGTNASFEFQQARGDLCRERRRAASRGEVARRVD